LQQQPTTGNNNIAAQTSYTYGSRSILLFPVSVIVATIWKHFFELAVVEKLLHFVSTVTTILILNLICTISQHDRGISPV